MVRDGYFYGLALIAVAVAAGLATGHWGWAAPPLLLAAFFLWFFRDPERAIPQEPGLIVSPADGKVTEVARIKTAEGDRYRLSIFLSVFDVHVNRSPVEGLLREVRYQKGEFLNALNPASAARNEQNLAVVECAEGYTISFTQIAGLLARRIVFKRKVGDRLQRGERVGLIKFGSRTDVVLPGEADVLVKVGERVRGGASVLARVPAPDPEILFAAAGEELHAQ
ncbi:MAG TPA: phosphatidylserine decarboxylase family protein [Acidobacteriaceae bacterium]|jgi:phosphatidylserine decarboxylase|nr:phosphatidylserine decarboxylase family protein [Acidobacteriaceae bacterium]